MTVSQWVRSELDMTKHARTDQPPPKSRKPIIFGLKQMALPRPSHLRSVPSSGTGGRGSGPYLHKLRGGPGHSSPGRGHRCSGWLCQNSILERSRTSCRREHSTGLGWTPWAIQLGPQALYTGGGQTEGWGKAYAPYWLSNQGSRTLRTC